MTEKQFYSYVRRFQSLLDKGIIDRATAEELMRRLIGAYMLQDYEG